MPRIPSLARLHAVRVGLLTGLVGLASAGSLIGAGAARAVVVDMHSLGQASVTYNAANQSGYYGVALTSVIGMRTNLTAAGVPTVTSNAACTDPVLSSDLGGPFLPATGLCAHPSATVMHKNETFALTWDPHRAYWQTTRNYVEQFLSDVANGSNSLTSPYAVSSQYTDAGGAAQNVSLYGGGCVDFGQAGGSDCKFGGTTATGTGYDYTALGGGCQATGTNQWAEAANGSYGAGAPNTLCLTDADIRGEVLSQVHDQGLIGRTKPGYTPLVVVLTPPGVVDCLDAAGKLCSANASQTTSSNGQAALFCSYHGTVTVPNTTTQISYVVQPWTAGLTAATNCDDPGLPVIPQDPSATQLATAVGARLVSPLSQGHLASITNPQFTGWFANDGSEINDNGCVPLPRGLDQVTVAQSSYYLQREFNNGGAIQSDPNSPLCAGTVQLVPTFVAPSAVNVGDVIDLDGSTSVSTLVVPRRAYAWDFGDGSALSYGPSVTHSYGAAGIFTIKLKITDRGGYSQSVTQAVQVLGANGQPAPGNPVPPQDGGPIPAAGGPVAGPVPPVTSGGPSTPAPTPAGGGTAAPGPGATPPAAPLSVHLQLPPQSLRALLRAGMAVRVVSNEAADGIVTMAITRAAARRAHMRLGNGPVVIIGRGTVGGRINGGTVVLHLRLAPSTATKLRRLKHLTVSVTLSLVGARGQRATYDVAGQF